MTKKRHKLLRRTMFENEINQATLGKCIGKSTGYISVRLNGQKHFNTDDMYKILDYFDIPHNQLHEFFPPNGFAE